MTEKSDQAYKTISEVSTLLDLPQHVLRFWETKFRQVSPLKRGGGRRYYRPQDVDLLRRIKALLHMEGYTIKGVQRMLSQGGVKNLPDVGESRVSSAPQTPAENEGAGEAIAAEGPSLDLSAIVAELEDIRDLLKNSPHSN